MLKVFMKCDQISQKAKVIEFVFKAFYPTHMNVQTDE